MNMQPEEYERYLDILEISPGASYSEIREAYLHLKSLYSEDSIVTLPIRDDISEERKKEILQDIEEAYQMLSGSCEQKDLAEVEKKAVHLDADGFDQTDVDRTSFGGQTLREIRERQGVDLQKMALSTRIQVHYLERIENEEFDALPPETYVRGFVMSYSQCLHLDPKKVAADYMKRYQLWKKNQ
jgi:curved DNA-binding protein CbpA